MAELQDTNKLYRHTTTSWCATHKTVLVTFNCLDHILGLSPAAEESSCCLLVQGRSYICITNTLHSTWLPVPNLLLVFCFKSLPTKFGCPQHSYFLPSLPASLRKSDFLWLTGGFASSHFTSLLISLFYFNKDSLTFDLRGGVVNMCNQACVSSIV